MVKTYVHEKGAKMICGYARVSTKYQEREGNSLGSQEQQLKSSVDIDFDF